MTFTGEYRWDIESNSVVFISKDGGGRRAHQVSEEALEDYFGYDGPAEQCATAFEANRREIERLAELAVAEGQLNSRGGASITSEWLTQRRYRPGGFAG